MILAVDRAVSPQFFDLRMQDGRLFGSLIDVLNRGAPVALLALGMVLVIATRGIDLSVGAVMAISGAIAASLADAHGLPLALAAALGAGLLCGLWNGFLVAVLGIQPIVATLILMVAGRGIAQLITEGRIVTFTAPDLVWLGNGAVLGVPAPVVVVLGMLIVTGAVVRGSALGLLIEATGGNARASELAGIGTRGMILAVYVWCGLCAALAGIIAAADIMGADANNAGLWLELDAILAVVIGGTSLFGGRFSLVLAMVGALIIQAMNTGILLSGYPPEFNLVVKAAVVLVVLLLQSPRFANAGAVLGRARHEAAAAGRDHRHGFRRRLCALHGAISQFRLDPRRRQSADRQRLSRHRRDRHDLRDHFRRDRSVGRLGDRLHHRVRRAGDRAPRRAAAGRLCRDSGDVRRLRRGHGRHHPRLRHAAFHRHAGGHVPRPRRQLSDVDGIDPDTAPIYSTVSDFALRLPGGGRLTAIALIMLAVVAAGAVLLHFTRFGANVYALGGSRATTALMGIPVGSMTVRIYMLSSVLAGLAGIVFSFYTAAGYSLSAVGVELDSIAAVVIGGTLLTGGQGSVVGTLLGVLIQGLIQTYINFDGTLSSWWTKIVTGILLFAFIALQQAMLGIARRAGPRKAGVQKS